MTGADLEVLVQSEAFKKLADSNEIPLKKRLEVANMMKIVHEQYAVVAKEKERIGRMHAEMDDKGNAVTKDNFLKIKDEENRQFLKELLEMLSGPVNLNGGRVQFLLSDLEPLNLTARDLNILSMVIEVTDG